MADLAAKLRFAADWIEDAQKLLKRVELKLKFREPHRGVRDPLLQDVQKFNRRRPHDDRDETDVKT